MDKQKKKSDRPNESKGNEESKRDSKSRIYSEPTSDSSKLRFSSVCRKNALWLWLLNITPKNGFWFRESSRNPKIKLMNCHNSIY